MQDHELPRWRQVHPDFNKPRNIRLMRQDGDPIVIDILGLLKYCLTSSPNGHRQLESIDFNSQVNTDLPYRLGVLVNGHIQVEADIS